LASRCQQINRPTRLLYLYIKPNLEIASDHTPIIGTISTQIIICQQPPKLHNSQINWEAFRNKIKGNLPLNIALKTAKEIKEANTQFNEVIQKAVWRATPDDKHQAKYPE
jgi:hypothetical protein